MRYLLGTLCFCAALFQTISVAAADPSNLGQGSMQVKNQIQWETNFERAAQSAQELNKPMLLLFTGSDWCTWCIRLEDETFSTTAFADRMKDKFIYVKLDFPMNSKLPPDLVRQNKALKAKYKVEGFPSVVILNSKGEKIGNTGYRAGGPVKYGQLLLEMSGQN